MVRYPANVVNSCIFGNSNWQKSVTEDRSNDHDGKLDIADSAEVRVAVEYIISILHIPVEA